jgi:hypothetical protein
MNSLRLAKWLALIILPLFSHCATLKEVAALRRVDFSLNNLSDLQLAGISLNKFKSYQDIGLIDAGRLGLALASNELPLTFIVHVRAENPADNTVPARLVGLAWTLFLQDKETVSGNIAQNIVLPPGEPQDVPVTVNLNMLTFFDGGIRDMVDMALSLSGQRDAPKNIRLQVTPTINTPLGPIQYPQPITVINKQIGS